MILSMLSQCFDASSVGILQALDQEFHTLELPWRDNQTNISCVPAGDYQLIAYQSPMHGRTYCLHNPALKVCGTWPPIPGCRTSIELHSANWATQLLGCIALGYDDRDMLDPMTGVVEPAVEQSRDAVAHLLSILTSQQEPHTLSIARTFH